MKASDRKQLKAIGHHLKPVLIIAGGGLSEGVLAEAERAIHDHEVIKVKLNVGDREMRQQLITELASSLRAEVVQTIGNMAVLFRENAQPDPRLSNRLRAIPAKD
ncbi:MAG: YhbY family RNA-binding protein [Gammaproteobacteria bacterium]|nr:MAG: YhbY family RNA-binding protein [Gammaproteobacteria bacterium]